MSTFLDKLRNEPAVVVAAFVAVAALFGVRVSDASASGATQTISFLVPIIGGLVTRHHVTPARKP